MKTFKQYLSESKLEKHADHFVDYCCDELGIKNKPEIKFVNSKIEAKMNTSFGGYYPGEKKIKVNTAGRHVVDVFRTLAHELVHHKQNEDERLDADSGKTGSEIENEANSKAGILLRNYGKAKPELFESVLTEVFANDISDKETLAKEGGLGASNLGKKPPKEAKHIGTLTNGHKVWHSAEGDHKYREHEYHVTGPNGKTNIFLQTYHYGDEKAEHVGGLISNKESGGAHKLYQHLVTKHDKIIYSDDQSPGARKVWAKAGRHPKVNIHGWHERGNGSAHDEPFHAHPNDDDAYVPTGTINKMDMDRIHDTSGKDVGKHDAEIRHMRKMQYSALIMHKK